MSQTLISSDELLDHLFQEKVAIFDVRFQLFDTQWGQRSYQESHIPGAAYLHLDNDLCSPGTNRGRHPLLDDAKMVELFSRVGIDSDTQVVVYDQGHGGVAARLWWMLKYAGHDRVAILDGGFRRWQQSGFPTHARVDQRTPRVFGGTPRPEMLASIDDIRGADRLVDARAEGRYSGKEEKIDPVAGHIPTARNHFFVNNLKKTGLFREKGDLQVLWADTLDKVSSADTIVYCGSGVTACHLVLSLAHLGAPLPRMYAGSFSEWCQTEGCAVESSSEPGSF